jgi:hypothetical protein
MKRFRSTVIADVEKLQEKAKAAKAKKAKKEA